jgi:chorismate lyase / 3-hydroxybenzoate synthase
MQEPAMSTQIEAHVASRALPRQTAGHTLGRITCGASNAGFAATTTAMATQHVYAKQLHPAEAMYEEYWFSQQPTRCGHGAQLNYHYSEDVFFGVIEIHEPEHLVDGVHPLNHAAYTAYLKLFDTLDTFNAGRQRGFALSSRSVTGNVPAACALGVNGGPLSVAFLAGRSPTRPIENPRQVSAYHYPAQYGSQSPTFSRASLAQVQQQELLFLSGTASIVGHQTMHVGDVKNQTIETLANIQAVIDQANLHKQGHQAFGPQDLQLRVYVRHAQDCDAVRAIVNTHWGWAVQAVYLQADICRADLDVEIEGIAWHTMPTPPAT